jgi:flagellin
MTSQIRGLGAAISNANDAISMVNTAEGALDEVTAMLQRMRELAVQAGTGTTDSADRTYLQSEFAALRTEIDRVADNTKWNGRNILDGSAGGSAGVSGVVFGIGQDGTVAQSFSTSFGNFNDTTGSLSGLASKIITGATVASAITNASASIGEIDTVIAAVSAQRASFGAVTNRLTHTIDNLTNVRTNSEASRSRILDTDYAAATTNASASIGEIDTVIAAVSAQRASFGAVTNRLTHAVDNLTNVKTNSEGARSRILDTDYAAATSELARTQIIQQAGTAMLAQANQMPQTVLALLQ